MKLVKPSFEIIEQAGHGYDDVCRQIEAAARTCYRSGARAAEGTARPFVERLIASGHGAMLEHGTVYLATKDGERYAANPHSRAVRVGLAHFVTTNLRVIVENGWEGDLALLCEPCESHVRRVSVRFVCSRQVSHEFVRHRAFSFAQESTRYVNYAKAGGLEFVEPTWGVSPALARGLEAAEACYAALIGEGQSPQQAAAALPNATRTELVMTGFADEDGWQRFFRLRAKGETGRPHPQASELAVPLMEEFRRRGWLPDGF